MKRHPSLVLLSRDHHEGLLLATRLQQGRTALTNAWSHDLFWQSKFVSTFFKMHLQQHFHIEEEILFPLLLRFGAKEDRDAVAMLVDEHRQMEEMNSFFLQPEEKKLECNLTRFGEVLEGHIRKEERWLFPLCERIIPQNELQKLGTQISEAMKVP